MAAQTAETQFVLLWYMSLGLVWRLAACVGAVGAYQYILACMLNTTLSCKNKSPNPDANQSMRGKRFIHAA